MNTQFISVIIWILSVECVKHKYVLSQYFIAINFYLKHPLIWMTAFFFNEIQQCLLCCCTSIKMSSNLLKGFLSSTGPLVFNSQISWCHRHGNLLQTMTKRYSSVHLTDNSNLHQKIYPEEQSLHQESLAFANGNTFEFIYCFETSSFEISHSPKWSGLYSTSSVASPKEDPHPGFLKKKRFNDGKFLIFRIFAMVLVSSFVDCFPSGLWPRHFFTKGPNCCRQRSPSTLCNQKKNCMQILPNPQNICDNSLNFYI